MEKFKLYIHISPSWKCYVGITSLEIKDRWGKNGNGYKSQYFGRAIKKYGWNNFLHIIVADELSKSEACEMEKLFVQCLKSNNPNYGYNISVGGDCVNLGMHHTDNVKKRIADRFSIQVDQYGKNGEFIKRWESMRNVERELGIDASAIAKCCKGVYGTSKGFVWRYKGDSFKKYEIEKIRESSQKIKVKQFSKEGKLIKTWNSISDAAAAIGVSSGMISQCCKGKRGRKTVSGFVWRYENDEFLKYNISNEKLRKVIKLEDEYEKEIYNSLVEAGEKNGIRPNDICLCCRGHIKTAGGFRWKYA